jgi:DNA-binding CsgD family transcriptional regulator
LTTKPKPGEGRTINLADLHHIPTPSPAALQNFFNLTPGEVQIAQSIIGETVEEIAERLGVKLPTARTQLASVFAKTGTRRQAQLVALLVRVAHIPE